MLKDLQSSLSKYHISVSSGNKDKQQTIIDTTKEVDIKEIHRESIDTDIACDVVGHIFRSIDMCLEEDKSKVKLSLFTKSFIILARRFSSLNLKMRILPKFLCLTMPEFSKTNRCLFVVA